MKKILSVVLSALLLISIIPLTASAATIVDSGLSADFLAWTLDDEGTLTISGTEYMHDTPWLNHCDAIKSVKISDGIKSIAFEAFVGCRNLQEIIIPDSVTSIEDGAFAECRSLQKITIPDGVTNIGDSVFYGCRNLQRITIPNSVKHIEMSAFYNCRSLQEITIPDGITNISSSTFANCTGLQKITIPDSIKSIQEGAFYECTSLTEVYFGGTKDQWQKILIDDTNSCLDGAVKHFNCDPKNAIYTAVITASTCTQQGYTTYTCSCGASYVTDFVDTQHSYRQYESGEIVFNKCVICGSIEKTNTVAQIERKSHLAYFLQYRETNCETDEQQIDNSVFFDGKVTKHNIDGLLLIAFWNRSNGKYYEMMPQQSRYAPWACNIPLEDMNEMFFTSFGLENIDFSIAQRYDVDTEMFYSPGGYGFEIPLHVVSVENGQYVVRWYDFEEGTEEISKTPCMAVTFNEQVNFTGIYFPDIPDVIPENDHVYTSEITTSATHLTEGVMTYTCSCGDSYTEVIAKTTEHSYKTAVTSPSCTDKGYTTYICECGDSYTDNLTDMINHSDADNNGKCDMCQQEMEEKEEESKNIFNSLLNAARILINLLMKLLKLLEINL